MSKTITATMIVRNEAERLRQCLDSIRPLVSEIVAVDTGSDDGTLDILREYGVRYIESPWRGDFSYHRNEAFDLATGDFCFIVDGDEELSHDAAAHIRNAVDAVSDDVTAIMVCVETHGDHGAVQRFFAQRVVRRGAYRYALPVHNQLIPTDHTRVKEYVCRDGLIISHYKGTMQRKADRSMPMLMALYESDEAEVWARYGVRRPPDMPSIKAHSSFFITKTYAVIGDHTNVVAWGALCESLVGVRPNFAELWVWMYYSHVALAATASGQDDANHHHEAARGVLERGLRLHPMFTDLRRCAFAQAALDWLATGRTVQAQQYARISASGLQHMGKIPEACQLVGVPIGWRKIANHAEKAVEA